MAEVGTKKKKAKKAVKKVSGRTVSKKAASKKAGVLKNSRDSKKEVMGRGLKAESPRRFFRSNKRKMKLVAMNLALFFSCFLFSFIVFSVSSGSVRRIFSFLSIISGAVSGAFVLVFLILVFMRFFRDAD